jgi:ferredoxin
VTERDAQVTTGRIIPDEEARGRHRRTAERDPPAERLADMQQAAAVCPALAIMVED